MRSEQFYEDNNEYFEENGKRLNYTFLNSYSSEELHNLRESFSSIIDYDKRILPGKRIREDLIKEYFLKVIESLGNKELLEYFKERVDFLRILRDPDFTQGNASLNMFFLDDEIYADSVILPDTYYTHHLDVASFAHELGHLASYENKPKELSDFYEYSEVLPILLEYFTFTNLQGDRGVESFYRGRLNYEKKAAVGGMRAIDALSMADKGTAQEKYFLYDVANSCKYLTSSDFAFQAVDLLQCDREEVVNQMTSVLLGKKSASQMKDALGIDTSGCKRLVKEYNRRKISG